MAVKDGERLQKYLAQLGLGSRREIERWIEAGRIVVNGKAAVLGIKVTGAESIKLDGQLIKPSRQKTDRRVIALNKPEGTVCSRRPEAGCPSVFTLLPKLSHGRWISIGRLDINTSGVLLFTQDGELAHRLMHPSYQVDREYAARILGEVDNDMLTRLRTGVEIDGENLAFVDLILGDGKGANKWFYCLLQGGRNREVRRLWESQGLTVSRLMRVRFANIMLPQGTKKGKLFDITPTELNDLYTLVKLRAPKVGRVQS